jgi:predicted ATPase with chaperone activity
MSATFIRRGAYQVTYQGQAITVLAANPCTALMIAARIFGFGNKADSKEAA